MASGEEDEAVAQLGTLFEDVRQKTFALLIQAAAADGKIAPEESSWSTLRLEAEGFVVDVHQLAVLEVLGIVDTVGFGANFSSLSF